MWNRTSSLSIWEWTSIIGVEWIRKINKKVRYLLWGQPESMTIPHNGILNVNGQGNGKETDKILKINKENEAKPQKNLSSAPQKPQEISLLDSVKASRTNKA
jgi:hypothetical protein